MDIIILTGDELENRIDELLQKEKELAIQNYLAPDLVGDWEGG